MARFGGLFHLGAIEVKISKKHCDLHRCRLVTIDVIDPDEDTVCIAKVDICLACEVALLPDLRSQYALTSALQVAADLSYQCFEQWELTDAKPT